MRVLYYIPYLVTTGADHWIYKGWQHGFTDLGHSFTELTISDPWKEKLIAVKPDILFITNFVDLGEKGETLIWARRSGIKVFLVVDWPMNDEMIEIIRSRDIADIYFGEREVVSMREFQLKTGRTYHLIRNAADKTLHFPVDPVRQYDYDIVYLGGYLPKKKRMFEEVLLPLTRKYRVGIFGPYWTIKDNFLRAGQTILRKLNLTSVVSWINRHRIVVPAEKENQLYSSAKICLNFHEREEDGSQPHYILNQRTFKIPACGGFEICDHVPALRECFEDDEVVMSTATEWFTTIDYYLKNEPLRRDMRLKGAKRALRDHTYHNRVEEVLRLAHSVP